MTDRFDKAYWETHWNRADPLAAPAHPALAAELVDVVPGTALDAGCGEGAESIWLAAQGWRVTGADISARALEVARARAVVAGADVDWVEADLSTWVPASAYDLVTTFYAHPTIPQLEFYDRIAQWVKPGGTLLIVGHAQTAHPGGHAHGPPAVASVAAPVVAARLSAAGWSIQTAAEGERMLSGRPLHDVVVRSTRQR